jgi:hypothetical protein
MNDPTEDIRRTMTAEINAQPGSREHLEQQHGQVWDTQELQRDFIVLGFCAPFVIVAGKESGRRGSLLFQHSPRLYHSFRPE